MHSNKRIRKRHKISFFSLFRFSEQSLGRDYHLVNMRADRAALQEGRLLLQALPSHGPVNLGGPRARGRDHRGRRSTPSNLTFGNFLKTFLRFCV